MNKTLILSFFLLIAFGGQAQENLTAYLSRVNLNTYTWQADDESYLRQEMPEVDFLFGPKAADVHIFFVNELAGLDATRLRIHFLGQNQFVGQNDTVTVYISPAQNHFNVRSHILKAIKKGLFPYILQTGSINQIDMVRQDTKGDMFDLWNENLFGIGLNGTYFDRSAQNSSFIGVTKTNQKNYRLEPFFRFAKVAENWRFDGNAEYLRYYSETITNTSGAETKISYLFEDFDIEGRYIHRLKDQVSVGGLLHGDYDFTDKNWDAETRVGVEYSFIPYEKWFYENMTLAYSIGYDITNRGSVFFPGTSPFDQQVRFAWMKRSKIGFWNIRNAFTYQIEPDVWNLWTNQLNASASFELGKKTGLFLTPGISFAYSNRNYSIYDTAPVYSKAYRYSQVDFSIGFDYFFGKSWRPALNPRMIRTSRGIF